MYETNEGRDDSYLGEKFQYKHKGSIKRWSADCQTYCVSLLYVVWWVGWRMKVHAWTQSIHLKQSQRCHEAVGLKRLNKLFKAIHVNSRTTTASTSSSWSTVWTATPWRSLNFQLVLPSKMSTRPIVTSQAASAQTTLNPYKPCSPPNSCHATSEFCFHLHSDFLRLWTTP